MSPISDSEKQTRTRVVASVTGSNAMEGITLQPEAQQLLQRYATGELSLEEFSEQMDSCASTLLARKQPLVSAA